MPAAAGSVTVKLGGTGHGAVVSVPAGLTCTADRCEASFAKGTVLTLSAMAEGGSHFAGWGGVCAGLQRCVVRAGDDQTLQVRFVSTNADPTSTRK